jgi:RAB protein geranylgeranyltransferase component A
VNAYYGGDEASLAADELALWVDSRAACEGVPAFSPYIAAQREHLTSITRSGDLPPLARHFSLSLAPALIPAVGPFISSLVASGVARYGSYRLLETVAVFDRSSQQLRSVPASKEDIFKATDLSLLEKRRLMRFLMFATDEFEDKPELVDKEQEPFVGFLTSTFKLDEKIAYTIAYALAFCPSADGRISCPDHCFTP